MSAEEVSWSGLQAEEKAEPVWRPNKARRGVRYRAYWHGSINPSLPSDSFLRLIAKVAFNRAQSVIATTTPRVRAVLAGT